MGHVAVGVGERQATLGLAINGCGLVSVRRLSAPTQVLKAMAGCVVDVGERAAQLCGFEHVDGDDHRVMLQPQQAHTDRHTQRALRLLHREPVVEVRATGSEHA